jgi:hypothetical protein
MIDAYTAAGWPSNFSGIHGTSGSPITIKALNDGKVLIDGEGARTPIWLYANNWTVIEGINARNGENNPNTGGGTVLRISSDNVVVRRVVVWDAGDTNSELVGVHYAQNVLLEDIAAFGIARKVYSASQDGNYVTCRRCWGRWEGSHYVGPKHTLSLVYNNYNMTVENFIGTWSGEKMKQTYYTICQSGDTNSLCGRLMTNYEVDQPYGVFAIDNINDSFSSNKQANSKILGSIAYIQSGDMYAPSHLLRQGFVGSLQLKDVVAYIGPGSHSGVGTFVFYGGQGNLVASNLTGIGGAGMSGLSNWQTSNTEQGATPSNVSSIFTGTAGATVCKRYRDGVLTNEPLWPWPMDQRIYDAMIQAGRTPFYVTQKIESIFGPIPSECRSSGGGQDSQAPANPVNLRMSIQ